MSIAQVVASSTGRPEAMVAAAVLNVMRADGRPRPFRHAVGAFTSRPATGALSCPPTNAPTLRQNDANARSIVHELSNGMVDGTMGVADA
jgi:hypothetical protein